MRNNPLKITDEMRQDRIGYKMNAVVMMDPMAYLRLTTLGPANIADIREEARDLEDYNAWEGSMLPVFLTISPTANPACGLVKGHEGRHRVAAMLAAGEDSVEVTLRIARFLGHPKKQYDVFSVDTSIIDLWPKLHGQYSNYTARSADIIHEVLETNIQAARQDNPEIENRSMDADEFRKLMLEKVVENLPQDEILDALLHHHPGTTIVGELATGFLARMSLFDAEQTALFRARDYLEEDGGVLLDIRGQNFDESDLSYDTEVFSAEGQVAFAVCQEEDAKNVFGRSRETLEQLDPHWDETHETELDAEEALTVLWDDLEHLLHPLGWYFTVQEKKDGAVLLKFMPQAECRFKVI